jgi:hypothetical protein
MSNELAILDAVSGSNLSQSEKSLIARWADKVSGGRARKMIQRVGLDRGIQISAVVDSVRQGSESLMVGGGLGLLHSHVGLDITDKKIPVDGVLAAAALLGSAVLASQEYGKDLRNIGSSAASIFAFRQGFRFAAAKSIKAGEQPKGTFAGEMEDFREEFVDCSDSDGDVEDEGDEFVDDDDDGSDFGDEDPIVAAARGL